LAAPSWVTYSRDKAEVLGHADQVALCTESTRSAGDTEVRIVRS
jgi:hypothetical protein